jgi:hypothetical protein
VDPDLLGVDLLAVALLVEGGGVAGLQQRLDAVRGAALAQERLGPDGGAAGDEDLRGVVVAGRQLALQLQIGLAEAGGPEAADGAGPAVGVLHRDRGAVQALGPVRRAGAGEDAQLELQALGVGVGDGLVDLVVGDQRAVGDRLQVGPGDLDDVAVDDAAEGLVRLVLAVEQTAKDRLERRAGGAAPAGVAATVAARVAPIAIAAAAPSRARSRRMGLVVEA